MTSPWYNPTFLSRNSRALAEAVNAEFAKIRAAFDQLPAPGSVGTGTQTVYTHFAYADSADGTANFTTGSPGARSYVGIQPNSANPTPSAFPVDYEWSRIGAPTQDDLTLELNAVQADAAQALADAATAIANAATAQGTADGKVTTFLQDEPPLAEGVGDLWIDTNDGNRLYRWNGTLWSEIRDAGIAAAIVDAATAQATADGKIVSFFQDAEPTAAAVGDFWIDTNDSNKLYRWSGTAWETARDAGIALALDAINTISDDGILSRDEKPEIRKQRDAILSERPIIRARAVALGVSVTNYDADYTALIAYLGGLAIDSATDTAITRTTFNTFFTDYYGERQTVLDGIAAEAAKRATVAGAEPGLVNSNIGVVDGNIIGIGDGAGTPVGNALVPIGGNAVVNSEFTRGKFGWRWNDGTFESDWGVNLTGSPNWFGHRNVMYAEVPGPSPFNSNRDLAPDALWNGAPITNAPLLALPVVEGDRVVAAVQAATHRCTFQLFCLFFDGAGAFISDPPNTTGGTPGGAANGDLANFTRINTPPTAAPANARWAIPMMRLVGTGEVQPFIFFTEPMITKIAAGQTAIPAYVPGRADANADVTSDAQITTSQPSAFQIQADAAGVTTTDLATQTRSFTLSKGGTVQTSGVTVGTPTATTAITVASAIVSGGIVTVTLSAANASGSVTIPVIFGGVTYLVTIPVTRTIAAPVAGGSGSQPFTDQTWPNITTASFVAVTDTGASVLSTSGGQLQFSFSAQYDGGVAVCKAQYSLDNSTWTDVPGTETTGSIPITVPGEEQPGDISRAATLLTGLTGSTLYYVRLVARRSAGTGTLSWIAPTFTARQP